MDAELLARSMEETARYRALPSFAAEIAIDSTADLVCERLFDIMISYQNEIDSENELGLNLVSFGLSKIIIVETIGPIGSNLIRFIGYDNGKKVSLVQHISQLSFLLCAVPKEPGRPRRTIGFQPWEENDEDSDE
jgi:hypothetical protein